LGDNFVQEGLANRITPFTTNKTGAKNFDTDKVYTNVMTKFKFGGLDKRGLYLDETVMRMCYTHRRLFAQLAKNLIQEGKTAEAARTLAYAEKVVPVYNVPINFLSGGEDIAKAYALLGNKAKAKQTLSAVFNNAHQYMAWYNSLNGSRFMQSQRESLTQMYIMNKCIDTAEMIDRTWAKALTNVLNADAAAYQAKGGQLIEE